MQTFMFILSSIIIIAMPGTGVIYTISATFDKGRQSGFTAAAGCTLGIVPHLISSTFLSGYIFSQNQTIFVIVQFAGALYITYMGVSIIISNLRTKPSTIGSPVSLNKKNRSVLLEGVMINLLNPKLTLFFFSFLPLYVQGQDNYFISSILYGCGFMLITFLVFSLYVCLADLAGKKLGANTNIHRYIMLTAGLLLLIFAAMMFFQRLSV